MPLFSETVARRLDRDLVGWLTTVDSKGQPQSSLVWFLRDANDLLIYSRAAARKLSNVAANPRVSFSLNSDPRGDSYVTMEATAVIVGSPAAAHEVPAYLAKYAGEIAHFGWTPPEFAELYPALIRLTIDRIRA
jgi:PPOX class probable F420-dependent enzyme